MISKGIDMEPVTPRFASKSIGCCKKFPGRTSIKGIATLNHWLQELAKEISERLEKDEIENNRRATQMVVSFMQEINNNDISSSRTTLLNAVDVTRMAQDALDVIRKNTQTFFKADAPNVLNNPIKFLGLNVGKFEDLQSGKRNTIQDMFKNQAKKVEQSTTIAATNETKLDIDENGKKSFFGTKANDPKKEEVSEERKENTIQNMFNQQIKKTNIATIQKDELVTSSKESSTESKQEVSEENLVYDKSTSVEASTLNSSNGTLEDGFMDDEVIESSQPMSSTPLRRTKIINTSAADIKKPEKIAEIIDSSVPSTSKSFIGNSENKAKDQNNDTSASANYKQTYAEYYLQSISPLIQHEVCAQCNKKIPLHEMQIHSDSHFAFELSQQQRLDYRNEKLKNSSPAPKPPIPKKQKLNGTKPESKPNGKIKEFLSKQTQLLETDQEVDDNTEKEKCQECGKIILLANFQMHIDFHIAKKLSEELNQQSPVIITKSDKLKKSTKGKTTKTITNNKSIKNITSFFTQQN